MTRYYQIIAQYELMEFEYYKLVTKFKGSIFDMIKYPHCQFYQGPWGPETLILDPINEFGYVQATRRRAHEIQHWFEERKPDVIAGFD